MSKKLEARAWDLQMSTTEKIVFVKMCDTANDNGENMFMGRRRLAAICCVSLRTLDRIIERFKEAKILTVMEFRTGRRRTVNYKVHVARAETIYGKVDWYKDPDDVAEGDAEKGCHSDTVSGVTPCNPTGESAKGCHSDTVSERVSLTTQKGVTDDTKGCQAMAHKNVNDSERTCADASPRAPEGAAPPVADNQPGKPPINARWRAAEATIRGRVTDHAWQVWLSELVPLDDDGKTLTLGAPGHFAADKCNAEFHEVVERCVGGRVVIRHSKRVWSWKQSRRARAG